MAQKNKKEFTLDGTLSRNLKRCISASKNDIGNIKDTLDELARRLEEINVPLEAVSYQREDASMQDADFASKLAEHFTAVFRLVCEARAFVREQMLSQYGEADAEKIKENELLHFGENDEIERTMLQEEMTKQLFAFDAALYRNLLFADGWNNLFKQNELLETGALKLPNLFAAAEEKSPYLATVLRENFFGIETFLLLSDRDTQIVLRETSNATIEMALKTASTAAQKKVFRNMSKRLAAEIKENMDELCITKNESAKASNKVGVTIARLLASGDIVLLDANDAIV